MLLRDGETMCCPICGGTVFCATAHVTQDWELDETGTFQKCLNDCVEVTHFPDTEDIWDCKNVGIAAQGKILSPRNRDGGTVGTRQNDDKK